MRRAYWRVRQRVIPIIVRGQERCRRLWRHARRGAVLKIEQEPEAQRFSRYHQLSDQAWLRLLLDSTDGLARLPMPRYPSDEIQAGFIGSSNRKAIEQGWPFYMLMADQRKIHGVRLGANSHVLDFGCGWGRFARMFLRDVPESNLWCADSYDLALATCREIGVPGRMVKLSQMPPSDLPSARYDLAFAYSVFSHLSPAAHAAWSQEFARVVKPGGLVFISTHARWLIDECKMWRENPDKIESAWHEKLSGVFLDYDESVERYDRGEFLYAPTGGAGQSGASYGEAIVPRGFFESQWGPHFEVVDFIADPSRCQQAVAVLRKHR
jgi:SAM-dependent methyltransferase